MLYICCYKYVFVLVVERYTQAVSKSYIRFDCGETSERDGLQGSSPCQEQTLFITVLVYDFVSHVPNLELKHKP